MRLLAATALLLLAAAPARADVTMDPLKACYVADGEPPNERETIGVHAHGFTPLAHVTLKIDSTVITTGQAGAFGDADANVPAPFQGFGERTFTLSVEEDLNPKNAAVATSRVTNLSVTLRPRRARPSHKVRFRGRGFTNAAPVFGHYIFGGEVRKTVRFARSSMLPCGIFHARRRQIPVRRPEPGKWTLQVDQQREFSPRPASNAQRVIIRVRETVGEP